MGLFNWLWGKKQEDMLDPQDKPRLHHYLFAHRVLPQFLEDGDSLLGILANPENQDFLTRHWLELGEQLEPREQLSPTGLKYTSHWLGGEHLIFLIQLPPAFRCTEAPLVAITTSPQIRYFTLETAERTMSPDMLVLGEWDHGNHLNYGHDRYGTHSDVIATAFLKAVCRQLGVAETIEPPTPQQQRGMHLHKTVFDMTMPENLPPDEASQVEAWEQQAEAALKANQLAEAEQFYRRILELRLEKQGQENTLATLAHSDVVQALQFQQRYGEAEILCRSWWRICRRYRMLGHAETMMATRYVADCLFAQGKVQATQEMLNYRVLLAGLARGTKSAEAQNARSHRESYQQLIAAKNDNPAGQAAP